MPPKRLYEIDILRFIAAMMVVMFHYTSEPYQMHHIYLIGNNSLKDIFLNGYLGVKLFFIISGFVIFMSAFNSTPGKFLRSRILRLFPAFLIMCTITFLVCSAFDSSYHVGLKDYLLNATLIGTFASWAGIKLVAGVYWTLIVEMQFYFFIYLLLVFKKIDLIRYFLLFWLALSVFTYYGELYFNYHSVFNKIRILMITEHSYYFIAGCYFYLIKFHRKRLDIIMPLLILCFVLFFINSLKIILTGYGVFLLLFFGVFYLITLKEVKFKRNLSFYTAIGNLTYPLYLIHENIGIILINVLLLHLNHGLVLACCVASMLVLTYLFNVYVETPLTKTFKNFLFKGSAVTMPKSVQEGR